ncbi:hypothetical protein DFH06DRAFT_1344658 [Mycena polygramma]|nr:hypothetical protein DFH06DRAFT_1344658 [Mycena polygramma]
MAPGTRSRAAATSKNVNNGVISVDDSDSDNDTNTRRASAKRQKTVDIPMDEDIIMLDAPPTPPASVAASSALKNAHLKGRKRFAADFADLKAQGLELGGLALTSAYRFVLLFLALRCLLSWTGEVAASDTPPWKG